MLPSEESEDRTRRKEIDAELAKIPNVGSAPDLPKPATDEEIAAYKDWLKGTPRASQAYCHPTIDTLIARIDALKADLAKLRRIIGAHNASGKDQI